MTIRNAWLWLMLVSIGSAHALTADDAGPKCATAIDDVLRDPASAEYQWGEREVIPSKKGFVVMLPVRASNAYGGKITLRFVCRIENDQVVQLEHLK